MPLSPGARLGHYEILALIGAGGMGEVYRARDPRLDRTVAIKVLVDDLSRQPDARARFEREARAIAGLNHPHIATLHDVGRHGQTDFLVMELLEGETLAARLAREPIPLERGLAYAIGIAAALDQAHRQGVIHRDLKPGNVMLTRSGVKLLDFGLAKLRPVDQSPLVPAQTQTGVTSEGTVLGTLQYMAPEQLEGADADVRSDIFAFGVLLYEMVTGKAAFEGKSRASLMGSILKDVPPPVSALAPTATGALDRLVATCLAKDPDDRWQSARDVWRELTWIAESGAANTPPVPAGSGAGARLAIPIVVVAPIALALAVIAAAAGWWLKPRAPANRSPVVRLSAMLSGSDQIGDLLAPSVAMSPDGAVVAYVGLQGNGRQLFLRALDDREARILPGTEGASAPFFSPDGQWLGFFAAGKIKKVRLSGSAPQTVCDAALGFGGAWGPGDTIYYVPFATAEVWKVPAAGGVGQPLTTIDRAAGEVSHRWPQVLPGGKAIIFTAWTGPGSDERHLELQMLSTSERRTLVRGASTGRYVATGHLLYTRSDAVMAVPFDLATLQLNGQPVALGEHVLDDEGAHFSVSESGTFAYVPADPHRYERRLVWVDSRGTVDPVPSPLRPYTDPVISPDGRYAAFTNIGSIETIWIHDFSRGTQTAFTDTSAGSSQASVWTADGTRLVYRATRSGFRNLFWKAVDGSGQEERLTTSENLQTPTSSSLDKQIVYSETAPGSGTDLWVLPLAARTPRAFLKTRFGEGNARLSPDGRWLAYTSGESGGLDVYIRPFPGPGGKLQVSVDGGREPVWSRTGRELYYRQGDRMMVVPIGTGPALAPGTPRLLFTGRYLRTDTGGAGYDVGPDGRFLMVQPVAPEPPPTSINIVINWFDDLRQRVAAGQR